MNGAHVPLPRWNDPDIPGNPGTMIRIALWLVQEIGAGNTFTKEQLRQAFPGKSQADRRMRDLRPYGWVIRTNTEDATLAPEEQRFVSPGVPVWDPAARRSADVRRPLPAKERDDVLARDGYLCTTCGIAAGESYADDSNLTATLSVSRREVVLPGGRLASGWVTECNRCRAGSTGVTARADEVLASIRNLDPGERRRLAAWARQGKRTPTSLDRAWSELRRLPPEAREAVLAELT